MHLDSVQTTTGFPVMLWYIFNMLETSDGGTRKLALTTIVFSVSSGWDFIICANS